MTDIQSIKNEIDSLPLCDIDSYISKMANNTNDRFADLKMAYCLIRKQCLDEAWVYIQKIKKVFSESELSSFKCGFDREDNSLDDYVVYDYRVYKGCDGDYHVQEEGSTSGGSNNSGDDGGGGWCSIICCYVLGAIWCQDLCWPWTLVKGIFSPNPCDYYCGCSSCHGEKIDQPVFKK
ncbi:MAG: hypothetical protein ACI4XP_06480 [Acutalibacteraceae bacterium]